MSKQSIAKQRVRRKGQKKLRRQRRLTRRTRQKAAAGFTSAATANVTRQKTPQSWQSESTRPRFRWNMQLAAMLALCLTCVTAFAVPACGGGSKSLVRSFREESVEITSLPKDAEFHLNDIQGSPLVTTDSGGQLLSAAAYHPYGAVRYQKGRHGDPWGFVGNEEDRGSALSDFHVRPYRPELGIFASVDPQSLFQPEKIIGQPSRMYPYTYAAGNPVNLHGAYTASDVSFLQRSFDEAFGSKPYTYSLGKKTYDVKFRLDISEKGAPVAGLPLEGTNKITIVPKQNLGINPVTGNEIIGGATCDKAGCRSATFPIAHLRDGLTVPHEIGHLTGMQHHPDPENLMYKTTYGPEKKALTQSQVNTILDRPMFPGTCLPCTTHKRWRELESGTGLRRG